MDSSDLEVDGGPADPVPLELKCLGIVVQRLAHLAVACKGHPAVGFEGRLHPEPERARHVRGRGEEPERAVVSLRGERQLGCPVVRLEGSLRAGGDLAERVVAGDLVDNLGPRVPRLLEGAGECLVGPLARQLVERAHERLADAVVQEGVPVGALALDHPGAGRFSEGDVDVTYRPLRDAGQ